MGREADDAPPELAAWAGGGPRPGVRTAELAVVVTGRGEAWVCRLWAGDRRCVAVGRAGVGEPGGRGLAVARACEAAGFVMPPPAEAAKPTKARRRG